MDKTGLMVSVIMPVYNSKEYLENTVECMRKQTYKNFELILIDDGSNDGSSETCDRLAKKDSRILVIHKSNGGICNARNVGLSAAKGDYIAFCDNDDLVDPKFLEVPLHAALEEQAEIVRFRRRHELFIKGRSIGGTYPVYKKKVIRNDQWSDYLEVVNACGYGVWAGLYKRSFIENNQIQFDERIRFGYEDHIFITDICGLAERIVLIPDILYTWTQRSGNSTSCKNSPRIYQNRINGIFLWAQHEERVQRRLEATNEEGFLRKYDYLACVMDEIKANGFRGKEAAKLLDIAKLRIGFGNRMYNSYKKSGLYKELSYSAIRNNQFLQYYFIQLIHKTLRVLT